MQPAEKETEEELRRRLKKEVERMWEKERRVEEKTEVSKKDFIEGVTNQIINERKKEAARGPKMRWFWRRH